MLHRLGLSWWASPEPDVPRSHGFIYRAAFVSGLAEPAGATIGLFAATINPGMVPLFMAFAAGAMIFVSL